MIGALVAILSLNLTSVLISDYGVVAGTLPVTGATVSTPIQLTSPAHGFASGRTVHAIVSGVGGTVEANGLWALSVVDPNTFSLATFTAQGIPAPSVGVNAYTSGGQIQYAFPDGSILLGRRNVALATAAATPRIVFVPTDGRAWGLEPYGGAGPDLQPADAPPDRGSAQQQSMTLGPQLATQFLTFEVHVSGSGPNYGEALSPDFYDLDATQALVFALYSVLFDAGGAPRARVLRETWPSQRDDAGSMSQRGQKWVGTLEMQCPVQRIPRAFVPIGTTMQLTIEPANPGPGDAVVIEVP